MSEEKHPAWLEDLYGVVRCGCGHRFKREEMTVVDRRDAAFFVRCKCSRCAATAHVVIVGTDVHPKVVELPPVVTDDVLDAHDRLQAPARLADLFGEVKV